MNKKANFGRATASTKPVKIDLWLMLLAFFASIACVAPLVTAYQLSPQPAFANQWLAALLWACVALLGFSRLCAKTRERGAIARSRCRWRALAADRTLLLFWGMLLAAIAMSVAMSLTPWFIAAPSFAVIALACATSVAIVQLSEHGATLVWRGLLIGLLVAALSNAFIAALQVFAPRWYDDVWIAQIQGARAFGNLRQPNLLALLSLWGLASAFALFRGSMRWLAFACATPLLAALWWSGSRAGWLGLLIVIVCWIAQYFDAQRTASRNQHAMVKSRSWHLGLLLLLATCALFAIVGTVYFFSTDTDRVIAVSQRLSLWRDVWQIIIAHPWLGVGFGQLNFAWTLTELPSRSPDVFDHAHNLPLQWAAEFGGVTTALLLGLLGWTLVRSIQSNRLSDRFAMLAIIGVALWHSLTEYPLWFAHFLLPTAACAALLARPHSLETQATSAQHPTRYFARALISISAVCVAAGLVWVLQGYRSVAAIYANANQLSAALSTATKAQEHPIYGYFGDYAKIMLEGDDASLTLFARAPRAIIDEKLLTAWARALERESRYEEAAYIIARAREFPADRSFEQLPVLPSEALVTTGAASSAKRAINLSSFRR